MKNLLLFTIFLFSFFSGNSQKVFDVKLKTTALVFESSVAAQAEYKLGPFSSVIAGLGYNNTNLLPSLQNSILGLLDVRINDSGVLGELGLRYYTRPYHGMDQAYVSGAIRMQGPSNLSNNGTTMGFSFKLGTKHVFTNRLFLESFIGVTSSYTSDADNSIRSSLPFYAYGVNIGYRIIGDTTRGTAEFYGKSSSSVKKSTTKKSTSSKSSSKKKSKKKKKKKKKRRN